MSTITQFPSGNTQYRIEFDYLARTFVVVTLVNSSNPTLNRVLEVGRDYRFLNPTMIEMLVDQSGFDIVRIHRQTGTDLVVDFRNGSVLTASDLTNAELQAIHIAEEGRDQTVDLAKEYADAAGSSAGNAKDSEDEARRIAESIKASGLIGYITRRSFEKGFNVIAWNEVLLWEEDGDYYRWDGTLPKNVPAGSTPETSGGIGLGAWVSVGDASLRADISSEGGDRHVHGFSSIQAMATDATLTIGQKVSTGGSRWEIVSEVTPMPIANGLYAKLINELYVDDFSGTGTEKINALNAYITAGMASSYANATDLEAYKYSLKPVHILFTSRVESSVPLLLMRHVHYDQVGAQTYFNRQIPVGFYYAPTDLNTAATEPVVFELSGTSYVRKTGALIGTPDNDITDVNGYITMSDGFLFDLSVACSGGVKIGLNFSMAPGCKGTKTSIGITERGGNLVSAPLLGMYFRWSWGADFRSPKVLAMRQGIHLYKANAGLRITNPYVARVGANADNPELVYPATAWTTAGKNQNTGITCDTVRDFVIDEPVVEWWRQAFAFNDTDIHLRKPHVEDVGGNMIMRHNFVIANSYIDLDNWSQINYTCLSYGFFFCGQDGTERKVIARGMPPVGGFTNGMVGGTFTNAPLRVENVSPATTDYGSIGNWSAVNYLGMDFTREIFVNPATGNDENSGFVSGRAVASLERAIEIINIVQQRGNFRGNFVINVSGSIALTRVVRAYKDFRINAAGSVITSSNTGHIEMSGIDVILSSGTFSGTAALLRHVADSNRVYLIGSVVVNTPAIVTATIGLGTLHINQTAGTNTSGISKYVDGAGVVMVTLLVRAANRNTAIDSVPVSANQYAAISSITD